MAQSNVDAAIGEELTDHLARLSTQARRLSRCMNTILAEDGMREDLWRLMYALSHSNGMLMTELAHALVIPPPTATRFVDELVDAGLVFRKPSPDDGRKTVVHLSRMGHERYKRLTALLTSRATELTEFTNALAR